MDSISELERNLIAIGVILLLILFITKYRLARKGKAIEEEEESFPIYQSKDILLQDRPYNDASMGYIPSKSIGEEKNIRKSILYLILVLFFIWIILGFPISL